MKNTILLPWIKCDVLEIIRKLVVIQILSKCLLGKQIHKENVTKIRKERRRYMIIYLVQLIVIIYLNKNSSIGNIHKT